MENELDEEEEVSAEEQAEMDVYDTQYDYIKKRFGRKAAEAANYGWAVSEREGGAEVCTKVYGHGTLTTDTDNPDDHDFQEW